MPKRPPSLHFSLRPRRASQATLDEAPSSATDPPAAAPLTPPSPPKKRSSFPSAKRAAAAAAAAPSTADAALRTRTEVRANTRVDWTFPEPAELRALRRTRADTPYVERELELEPASRSPSPPLFRPARSSVAAQLAGGLANGGGAHYLDRPADDAYRFESPDAVGDAVAVRMRRWKRMAAEERRWNAGLARWEDRRDAWTGAAKVRLGGTKRAVCHRDLVQDEGLRKRRRSEPPAGGEAEPGAGEPGAASADDSDSDCTTLVPVPPPLVAPDHPIRSQIQPRSYRSIYTKIVAQGTAPSIPVNLRDIVSACVAGWKADGEWPPPRQPHPEPLAANGRRYAEARAENAARMRVRSRIGSIVGHGDAPPASPLSPAGDRVFVQDGEAKGLGMVGRGVRRMSRALRLVGDALMDHENQADGSDGPDVPGLVVDDE